MTATIHVCASCQARMARRMAGRGACAAETGFDLMAAIRALPESAGFEIVASSCLGPCGAGARLAVTAPDRWGWLFEGLRPGPDIAAFGAFLAAWQASPDGLPVKGDRPARLVQKTVGRLPPPARSQGAPVVG